MKPSEILLYALPTAPGQTLRYNHAECPAGTDTRGRLYITMSDACPHSVLAYCHNCGEGTVVPTNRYRVTAPANEQVSVNSADINPEDWEADPRFPCLLGLQAEVWLTNKKIMVDAPTLNKYGVRWNDEHDEIIIPIRGTYSAPLVVGYQSRNIHNVGSKYKTSMFNKTQPICTFIPASSDCRTTVIVEDYISGVACCEAGFNAVVLYGTHCSSDKLFWLDTSDAIIVWLDNDNDTVDKHADTIFRTLKMICPTRSIRRSRESSEPKHLSKTEIKSVLSWKPE